MTKTDRYAAAGVKLDTAAEAKRRIAQLVSATRTPLARGQVGGFGGMVRVPDGFKKPVLVMSTDGVGSKVLVAAAAGIHDTVGEDLVNHSVNDILVHGATPLAFLDYIAAGNLVPEIAEQIVAGVARACRAHDMTLAGGETAQMPDLYQPGHYDLAGSIVGVVEEDKALHGDRVTAGDQLIGYASTGLHTNGYTLARKIVFEGMKLGIDDPFPETGQSVREVLLAVHRSYASALRPLLDNVHAGTRDRRRDCRQPRAGTAARRRGGRGHGELAVAAVVPGADARRPGESRRDAARLQSGSRDDRGRHARRRRDGHARGLARAGAGLAHRRGARGQQACGAV